MKNKVDLSEMAITEGGHVVSKKEQLKQREESNKDVVIKQHGAYWVFEKDSIQCPECDSSDLTFKVHFERASENSRQRLQKVLYVADGCCRRCGCIFKKTRAEIVDIYEHAFVVDDIKEPIDMVDLGDLIMSPKRGFECSEYVRAKPKAVSFGVK